MEEVSKDRMAACVGGQEFQRRHLLLGDDPNRQFRAILSFDTSSIPDTAVIKSVVLKIKRFSSVGTNPFSVLGNLYASIKKGYFGGSAGLELADFNASATAPGGVVWFDGGERLV